MKPRLPSGIFPKRVEIACRHCGSTDVRPSHKAVPGAKYTVYRCRACKQHFRRAARPFSMSKAWGGLLVLLAAGVTVGFLASSGPTADAPPRADSPDTLAQTRALAAKGDAQAQYDLGRALWQKDEHAQALPWLQAAAGRGHAEAQYLLGLAYQYGRGTVQNFRAAQEQFSKAAEQGHLEAEYQLGIFHRDGLAGLPDKETAYVWLNLAAAQGHPDALTLRDKLTLAMTGEEILRAQEASSEALKRVGNRTTQPPHP